MYSTVVSIGYIGWEPRKLLELVTKPFVYVMYGIYVYTIRYVQTKIYCACITIR